MKLQYPELRDWYFVHIDESKPSEKSLIGDVYGDGEHTDGTCLITSFIVNLTYEQGVIVAKTLDANYILRRETINIQYDQAFPDCFDTLVQIILEVGKG